MTNVVCRESATQIGAVRSSALRVLGLAAVTVLALVVLGALSAGIAAPARAATSAPSDPAATSADPALDQTVSADEQVASGRAVVDAGHVDIGPHVDPATGTWQVLARDDSGDVPVWRSLSDLVIRLHDNALMDAPEGEDFAFMGQAAGQQWYVIPQVEAQGVAWLGWNTQDPAIVEQVDRGVTMRVYPASGPGRAVLFLQDGTFGKPLVLADSATGEPSDLWVDVATHVHANWVFTAAGVYLVPIEFTATTADGATHSARATVRFAVGDAASEEEAAAAAEPEVDAAAPAGTAAPRDQATPVVASGSDAGAQPEGHALDEVIWWVVGLAGLACVAAALFWWRSRATAAQVARARAEVAGGSRAESE